MAGHVPWLRVHESIDMEIVCQPPDLAVPERPLHNPIIVRSCNSELVLDSQCMDKSVKAHAYFLKRMGDDETGSPEFHCVPDGTILGTITRPIHVCVWNRDTDQVDMWVYFAFDRILPRGNMLGEYLIDIEIEGNDLNAQYGRKTTRPIEFLSIHHSQPDPGPREPSE